MRVLSHGLSPDDHPLSSESLNFFNNSLSLTAFKSKFLDSALSHTRVVFKSTANPLADLTEESGPFALASVGPKELMNRHDVHQLVGIYLENDEYSALIR